MNEAAILAGHFQSTAGRFAACSGLVLVLQDTTAFTYYRNNPKAIGEHYKVFGPFEPLMHSPQVMTLARSTGDYLRFNSALGNMLSELVILVTAREWSQDFEWNFHYPIALKAGIKASVADAIRDGRRPTGMTEDEEIVYDFSTELHKNKRVSDATFARADKRFGKKGVVDLTGINAYYTLLAMQLNVAQYVSPEYSKKMPRFPE